MSVSIWDPTVKMMLSMAKLALDNQLSMLAAKHAADHKKADAIRAAQAAIDGAIDALVNLQ